MRQDHVKRIFNWPVVPSFSELHWKYRFSSPLTSSACRRLIKIVRLISGQCSGHEGQRQHTVSRTTSEYIHFRVLYNDQQVTNITNFTRIPTSSRDILPINILVRYHTCSLFDINRKILTKVEIIGLKKLRFLFRLIVTPQIQKESRNQSFEISFGGASWKGRNLALASLSSQCSKAPPSLVFLLLSLFLFHARPIEAGTENHTDTSLLPHHPPFSRPSTGRCTHNSGEAVP